MQQGNSEASQDAQNEEKVLGEEILTHEQNTAL